MSSWKEDKKQQSRSSQINILCCHSLEPLAISPPVYIEVNALSSDGCTYKPYIVSQCRDVMSMSLPSRQALPPREANGGRKPGEQVPEENKTCQMPDAELPIS